LQIAELGELTRHLDIGLPDLAIAATATLRDFAVLTRNVQDFVPTGVTVIDPYVGLPADVSE
jgi:predicted nucleic acid-binding protein